MELLNKIDNIKTKEDKSNTLSFENEFIKPIFKDILKYSPYKLVALILNILTVPIYTMFLSPSDYGLYSISIATLSFICIIFSDWIGLSALRFFEEQQIKHNVSQYFGTLVTLLCVNLLMMFSCSYAFRELLCNFFHIPPRFLLIITILIIPVAIRALLLQVLRAQIKPGSYSSSMILNQIFTMVFAVLFIKYFALAPEGIIFAMTIVITFIDLMLIHQTKIHKTISFKGLKRQTLLKLCQYGMPLAIGQLSLWIMTQSNKFILQHYKGSFANGIVGVSYNLTYSIILSLFSIFIMAAMPRIIKMYEKKQEVTKTISKVSGHLIGMAMPFVIVFSLYPLDFVHLLANEKFAQAYIIIPAMSLSVMFMLLAEFTTIQYHLVNKTYIDTILKLAAGGFGIILNILLIPKFGIVAVGYTALTVNVCYFFLSLIIVVDKLKWKFPKVEFSMFLLSSIPLFIAYFILSKLNAHFILSILTLLFVYYFTYFTLNKKRFA